ncbi:MAG: hypothetical protein ACUVXG_14165 [Anaerolineae bacterium]
MDMRVYAYALEGAQEDLARAAAAHLDAHLCHWVADGARLDMGQGFPTNLKDQGAAFGPVGEVRWWRHSHRYKALLLTHKAAEGMKLVPGNWEGKEEMMMLQNLREPRVRPLFPSYPHGTHSGWLRAVVYYRDGVATFVSPRELFQED